MTRTIRMAGAVLAVVATAPAWAGSEIGPNDFRISSMGFMNDPGADAIDPAVAYNPVNDEFLVVWSADDAVNDELEIYGQRIDAATGAELGTDDFRISDMGPDGNTDFDARTPAVVYNPTAHEYLVVWSGDDATNDELEIFVQRLDATTGAEVGGNDLRISDMGPTGDAQFDAVLPDVAYNAVADEYLVVWVADDVVNGADEVYGQRLAGATAAETGTDDFRISTLGPAGDPAYDALQPAVAWNPVDDEYLVVFSGEDVVDGETEIHGQRLVGATGAETGSDDFRISDLGAAGDPNFDAVWPAVAHNAVNNEYLVVWHGDDAVNGKNEIFGQRLAGATGSEVGTDDFQVSETGPVGDAAYDALRPAVAWDGADNEFLVVWESDHLADSETEIFGQHIAGATGAETGPDDFRISEVGAEGDANRDGGRPAVAHGVGRQLVVWNADDTVDGELEIYGQLVGGIPGDTDGDGDVDVQDLLAVLAMWGACPGCPEDVTGDDDVDVSDLLLVLANWT